MWREDSARTRRDRRDDMRGNRSLGSPGCSSDCGRSPVPGGIGLLVPGTPFDRSTGLDRDGRPTYSARSLVLEPARSDTHMTLTTTSTSLALPDSRSSRAMDEDGQLRSIERTDASPQRGPRMGER